MGAEFRTLLIKSTDQLEIKRQFKEEQEQDLYENGHSYSGGFGMADGLEFKNETFKDLNKAEEWLESNARKWESALAVQVKLKTGEIVTLIGAWCSS